MFLNETRQALAVCISNDKLSVRYPLIVLDATAIRDAIVHSATIKQDNSIATTTTATVTTSEVTHSYTPYSAHAPLANIALLLRDIAKSHTCS
jgi:hypothetical protein